MPTVHHAIDVAATPADCWRVFSDLSTWARWFPMLQRVEGDLRLGGKLRLRMAAGPTSLQLEATVEELVPRERVRWVASRLGVRGDHSYSFDVNHPGTTRVTSRESFSGIGARLIVGPVFTRFDKETHESMERFKALVEAAKRP